jgi:hypothetical protein
MKRCCKCKEARPIEQFGKSRSTPDGLNRCCKACIKAHYEANKGRIAEYNAQRYAENKEAFAEKNKRYREENSEKIKEKLQAYYQDVTKSDPDKYAKVMRQNKEWRAENKERAKAMQKAWTKRVTDPLSALISHVRKLTWAGLRRTHPARGESEFCRKIGCTFPEMREALGVRPSEEFELDHICPMSQARTEEEVYKLSHFDNLRWVSKEDNYRKGARATPEAVDKCKELLDRDWDYTRRAIEKEQK